jgi:hypothetical protein
MNDLRTAAQQALEALEYAQQDRECPSTTRQVIAALRTALAQQDEPVEPVAWKQGNLVTFNEDPYPALGSLFVQFWDSEEVAARVYANDHETLRQRCAKVNAAPPQRRPLTEEEILAAVGWERAEMYMKLAPNFPVDEAKQETLKNARAVEKASWEKNHG